jgi:hypothetical protein
MGTHTHYEITMPTALVTGASSGIGQAFAQELAARQYDLLLVARSVEKLQQLAQALHQQYAIQVDVFGQDLARSDGPQAVIKFAEQRRMTVDLLVNNAGFGDYGDFAGRSPVRQMEMIQLNVATPVALTHHFLGQMQRRQSGSIITVTSIAGFQPMPYLSVYAASKAFLLHFSEALWAENQHTGVRILALCPGPTESRFAEEANLPNISAFGQGALTPALIVVRAALEGLETHQSTVVTGSLSNHIIVNLNRFFPRSVIAWGLERLFRG